MEHVVILYSAVGDSGTLFYIRISNFFMASLTHAFCFFFFFVNSHTDGFQVVSHFFFFFLVSLFLFLATLGLRCCGGCSLAVARGLFIAAASGCRAQAHLPRSTWNVLGLGAEPVSCASAGGLFTAVPREAPPPLFFLFGCVRSHLQKAETSTVVRGLSSCGADSAAQGHMGRHY